MDEARDIYQAHLDLVTRALWDFDFDLACAHHAYPHTLRFPDRVITCETAEDHKPILSRFRNDLQGLGATGYHRLGNRAFIDPHDSDRLLGAHWSYVLRGGNYVTAPYLCELVLVRRDDRWKCLDAKVPGLRYGIPDDDLSHPKKGGPV